MKNIYIFLFFISFINFSSASEEFVSLKKNKVNVRYGPSFDSDIKYIYKKLNLPLKQIDKKENSALQNKNQRNFYIVLFIIFLHN